MQKRSKSLILVTPLPVSPKGVTTKPPSPNVSFYCFVNSFKNVENKKNTLDFIFGVAYNGGITKQMKIRSCNYGAVEKNPDAG